MGGSDPDGNCVCLYVPGCARDDRDVCEWVQANIYEHAMFGHACFQRWICDWQCWGAHFMSRPGERSLFTLPQDVRVLHLLCIRDTLHGLYHPKPRESSGTSAPTWTAA